MNLKLAEKVLKAAQEIGVEEYCLCAGARNSPLVFLLSKATGVWIYHFFDERSAAFFALGRIKQTARPVGVITTSGTAVAELLPAAVEATYAGLPLLLLTADRPRRYRNTGAPQSIEQVGIFSHYIETCTDLEHLEEDLDLKTWSQNMPRQVNVCFDEPLIEGEVLSLDLKSSHSPKLAPFSPTVLRSLKNPLILVGGIRSSDVPEVVSFLKTTNAPIFAESISQLRGHPELIGRLIQNGEKVIPSLFEQKICDSVFRIGGVPTLRFWRDLEEKFKDLPVNSCAQEEWTGLSRTVRHTVGLQNLKLFRLEKTTDSALSEIQKIDVAFSAQIQNLQKKYPQSEVSLLAKLASQLQGQSVYLGNSLPIREWDLASLTTQKFQGLEANRGANGIDGQISTFLGWSEGQAQSWALLGDLTTLYDASGLWITPHLKAGQRRLVVINNQGGQIFRNMFQNAAFLNSHEIGFEKWAEQWGWAYQLWQDVPNSLPDLAKNLVIELKPDASSSDQFWQEYRKL